MAKPTVSWLISPWSQPPGSTETEADAAASAPLNDPANTWRAVTEAVGRTAPSNITRARNATARIRQGAR